MPSQRRASTEEEEEEEENLPVVDGDESSSPPQRRRKRPRQEEEAAEEEEEKQQVAEEEGEEGEEEEEEEEEEGEEQDEEVEAKVRGEAAAGEDGGQDDAGGGDSDGSASDSSRSEEDDSEFVYVDLPSIRKDVQCPICLGIIKKTRTVMECLHRFCRECIDKSMRLGNNECPACRTHCASRRSLRDDPNFDALIAALYSDIEKYEEEELAFHEEEKNRNKQIQASIAQVFQRQEALIKRRSLAKDTPGSYGTRSQRRSSRRRRNSRGFELPGSDDNEDENENDGGRDSSSADDRYTEVKPRRGRRRTGTRQSMPPSSALNSDGGCFEDDLEVNRDSRGISPVLVWNPEMLAWGRGGTRSHTHTRHGSASNSNNKNARNTRLSKLADYFRSLDAKDDELDVYLLLVSMDKERIPNLEQPYLCCRPSLSIRHLCEYVSLQTSLQAREIEILMVNGSCNVANNEPRQSSSSPANDLYCVPEVVDLGKDDVRILEGQETLGTLKSDCTSSRDHLILAYQQKETLASS